MTRRIIAAAAILCVGLAGCGDGAKPKPIPAQVAPADDVAEERAKMSADDRAAVDAQEWCVVMTEERLGSMGPPLKLTIKGRPVFVCCKGCQKKAEGNPDKSIATLEELKARKKQQSSQKQ